jgi:type IV pilus assembly protein PilA
MNAQRGTSNTLIIIVIVILVAIAAVTIPLWRNHRISGRIDAALKAVDAAKVAVMEAAAVHDGLTHIKAAELGYNPAASTNPYVARIEIIDGGRITLTTKDTGAKPDIQLLLTPVGNTNASIVWDCSVIAGDANLVPHNCRKAVPAEAPAATPSSTPTSAAVSPAHSS